MVCKSPYPEKFEPRDTSDYPSELFDLPNDPKLKSPLAPHETGGMLRVQRSGVPGRQLGNMFNISTAAAVDEMNRNISDEWDKDETGVPIHDGKLSKESAAKYLEEFQ